MADRSGGPIVERPLRGTDDLLATLRARVDIIDISRETIDRLARFTPGMASKYLADPPMRGMSVEALFDMLSTLGWAMTFVECEDSMAQVRKRSTKRVVGGMLAYRSPSILKRRNSQRIIREMSRLGGQASAAKADPVKRRSASRKGGKAYKRNTSPSRRTEIAREAAIIRWERVKLAVKRKSAPQPTKAPEQVI